MNPRTRPFSYGLASRRRDTGKGFILLVVLASVIIHALLLYTAEKSHVFRRLEIERTARAPGADRTATRKPPPPPPTCAANLSLAMSARMMICATPLMDGRACVRETLNEWSLGVTVCDALAMSTSVDLLPPEAVTQIVEQIEAEMLIEEPEPAIAVLIPEPTPPPPPPPSSEIAQPEPIAPPPPPPKKPQQIVEITKPKETKPPKETRLISDYDSSVEKETVARGSTEEMVAKPDPVRELEAKDNPREAAIAEIPDRPERPSQNPDAPDGTGRLTMRKPGESQPEQTAQEAQTAGDRSAKETKRSGAGLEVARGTGATDQQARTASPGKTGDGGGGGGRPLIPNLKPTQDVLERAIGGGSVDKLDNVASGDRTALNTTGWKHASFFNRMKRRIAQHWHPQEAFLRRDPKGNVYGVKDRHTLLRITLDAKGAVRNIVILTRSGVDVLDEAAVTAVRAAQPFPHPPAELVDANTGLIVFSFGFYFEVDREGRWKLFGR